jgi:hypothetical protein
VKVEDQAKKRQIDLLKRKSIKMMKKISEELF